MDRQKENGQIEIKWIDRNKMDRQKENEQIEIKRDNKNVIQG